MMITIASSVATIHFQRTAARRDAIFEELLPINKTCHLTAFLHEIAVPVSHSPWAAIADEVWWYWLKCILLLGGMPGRILSGSVRSKAAMLNCLWHFQVLLESIWHLIFEYLSIVFFPGLFYPYLTDLHTLA